MQKRPSKRFRGLRTSAARWNLHPSVTSTNLRLQYLYRQPSSQSACSFNAGETQRAYMANSSSQSLSESSMALLSGSLDVPLQICIPDVHILFDYTHSSHHGQRCGSQVLPEPSYFGSERTPFQNLWLSDFLHRQRDCWDPNCHPRCNNLLGSMGLADWPSHWFVNPRLHFPNNYTFRESPWNCLTFLLLLTDIVLIPGKLGTMDLCIRSILHSYFEHPPLLLRHVLPLQRHREPLRSTVCLLALLAILHKSIDLLDRRCPCSNYQQHSHPLRTPRSSILHPAPRLNMFSLRSSLR